MEMACRDRFGVFNATFFRLWTCSMCYSYLFQDSAPSLRSNFPNGHQLVADPSYLHPQGLTLEADADDVEVVRLVCSDLDDSACRRWVSCCQAAERCCMEQIRDFRVLFPSDPFSSFFSGAPGSTTISGRDGGEASVRQIPGKSTSVAATSEYGGSRGIGSGVGGDDESGGGGSPAVRMCPRTWDGFGCFKDTKAGDTASISCPSYIDQSDPQARAYKRCTENGTWWRDTGTDQEWTDYTSCVQMEIICHNQRFGETIVFSPPLGYITPSLKC